MRRTLLLVMALAAAFYAASFALDQHLRTRKGGWRLAFSADAAGAVQIVIRQPALGISNVTLVVRAESAAPVAEEIVFDTPGRAIPFGQVLFEDLTYLPGTVALDLFGHEIELLPRTLTVNRREYPWKSALQIELDPARKPVPRSIKPRGSRPQG